MDDTPFEGSDGENDPELLLSAVITKLGLHGSGKTVTRPQKSPACMTCVVLEYVLTLKN